MGAMTTSTLRADAEGPASDAALAARIAAHDTGAFETLMRRHNRRMFRVARAILLTVEDAADALGVPQATVRTRAHRARALLRAALAHDIDVATLDAFGFAGERCDRIVRAVLARIDDSTDAFKQETT